MKSFLPIAILTFFSVATHNSAMAKISSFNVTSSSIENNQPIPKKFSFCTLDGKNKTKNGDNVSPQLAWYGAPKETKSFAVVVVDPDVPIKFDDANKVEKIIAEDFPRQNFYHWVLIDIPAHITSLAEGIGKEPVNSVPALYKGIPLINDFAGGKITSEFSGYDGPCPPWNDVRLHHYHFTVYALDVATLKTKKDATGRDVIAEIEKHTIAKGELIGTYSNFTK